MREYVKQHKFWLVIFIVIFLINQLPFIADVRPFLYDEAWYTNTAYNFSQGNGFLNSVVGSGGNANCLLPMITGTLFRIFGYSLFTIRLTAVICGVITILFIHLCLKEWKCSVKSEIAVLAFLVSITLFNTIFRTGRPECVSLMCMSGGVWFLLRYIRNMSWGNMIGLAIFTFVSTLAHPYALLFYALAGLALLIITIKDKNWMNFAHLSLLLLTAICAIGTMTYIDHTYNEMGGYNMFDRFSLGNIVSALPIYIKGCFLSKHTLYMVPLLGITLLSCWSKERSIKVLAYITFSYFILFPFLFSTDLMMIGLGLEYVAFLATLLVAPSAEYVDQFHFKKAIWSLFAMYCILNVGISYYFNYTKKFEQCNTLLRKEIRAIIPTDAVVFASIRQYPLIMENTCFSDHYRGTLPDSFDYIVVNSSDAYKYDISEDVLQSIDDYTLIYERDTKQYGAVSVYKHK